MRKQSFLLIIISMGLMACGGTQVNPEDVECEGTVRADGVCVETEVVETEVVVTQTETEVVEVPVTETVTVTEYYCPESEMTVSNPDDCPENLCGDNEVLVGHTSGGIPLCEPAIQTVTVTEYVCEDGQVVETPENCPVIEPEVIEVTVYVCEDGTEVDLQSDCPEGEIQTVVVTIYICEDGSLIEPPEACPPIEPQVVEVETEVVVETTRFVCQDGTTIVDDPSNCQPLEPEPECEKYEDCGGVQSVCFDTTRVTNDAVCTEGFCEGILVDIETESEACGFVPKVPECDAQNPCAGFDFVCDGNVKVRTFEGCDAGGICRLSVVNTEINSIDCGFVPPPGDLIVATSAPPGDGTYTIGADNVPMVGHVYTAGSAMTITQSTYRCLGDDDGVITGGTNEDDINAGDHIDLCRLRNSETGTIVAGPASVALNGTIVFDEDFTVPAATQHKYVLECNLAHVDVSGVNDDAYSCYLQDLVAEDAATGDAATTTIQEDNRNGAVATITVTEAGSLSIEIGGDTPHSTIVLGDTTGVHVASWRICSQDEAFIVQELTLLNCIDDGGDSRCDTFGADDTVSNVKIHYENEAGEEQTKTGFLSGGRVAFAALDLFVPMNDCATLEATVDTNSVSPTAARSGDEFSLALTVDIDEDFPVDFEAVGATSGALISAENGFFQACSIEMCSANPMVLRKTKPTISLAAGSPSGAGVPGLSEVFRMNVCMDSRGAGDFREFSFGIITSDDDNDFNNCADLADAEKFEFYDLDNPSEKLDDDADWTFVDDDGDADMDCDNGNTLRYAILTLDGDATTPIETVGAGTCKTYVLRIDTTGASAADDDAIRVDLVDEDEADQIGDDDSDADAVCWDDGEVPFGGINGRFVKNLSVIGGTIQY